MALVIGSDYDLQGVPGVGLQTALALRAIGKGIYPPASFASQCPSFDKARDLNWGFNVCKRLAAHPNFPNGEIIKLYLCDDNLDTEWDVPSLVWNRQPNVEALVDMLSYGKWGKSDIRRHMLPMLSTIYLREMASPSNSKSLLLLDDDQYEFHSVKRIKIIHGQPYYLVQWKSHADDRMFVQTDEDVQLVDEAFPNEARRHKWLKGREKSGANRNRLLVPKEEKSRSKLNILANNMSKTRKGARPRPSWVQLCIKDFYCSKKPHVEMGQTSTRKSSPVSQRRNLMLG
ncbi:flap endonuclease GEN-like 1 [Triticum aestivum]|uniref:flap endonuclease GEN-like 1 n=1 Tax=Triticum aestivum TaxID=4565 RepID=UPI001D02ACDB|nr:flap endonuclease GEN-like 1 [Triticum aestivum]